MIWYILLFVVCVIGLILNNFVIKKEKWQKIINIILVAILCFFTGTRYKIGGYDYFVYERVYNAVPILSKFNFSTIHSITNVYEMEKGFLFLCSICKTLGFTYHAFNLVCSIIFYTCFYNAFKKNTKFFALIIIVFLYKLFFFQTFVLTRQMLCLGFFFLMIQMIKNGKFIKYLLCCIALSTIHTTSLILIPVYFIRYFKITKKRLLALCAIFLPLSVLTLLDISILPSILKFISKFLTGTLLIRVENYINLLSNCNPINILNTLEYCFLMLLIIVNYKHLSKIGKNDSIYLKLFLILLPILTILRNYEILARVKDYFVIVYTFIIIDLCSLPNITKKVKEPVCYLLIIILCFAGYIRTLIVFDNGGLLPYNSYINDDIELIE